MFIDIYIGIFVSASIIIYLRTNKEDPFYQIGTNKIWIMLSLTQKSAILLKYAIMEILRKPTRLTL